MTDDSFAKGKSYLNKIFCNSAWMIAAKVFNLFIGVVVSICVTRYIGAEQKGELANTIVISSFWGFLASSGMLDIIISKFSKEREKSGIIAASGMRIMFIGGVIAYILSILTSIVLNSSLSLYVAIYSTLYLFQCFSIYEYWFYCNSNSKRYAISQSIVHIVFLLLRLSGVPLNATLMYFIIVASLENIFIYICAKSSYKKLRCHFQGQFIVDYKIIKDLIRQATPLIVMGFATTIYMKVDQIMVGKLLGCETLGYYSVAVNLAEYWYFVPGILYSSFLPAITEAYTSKINNKILMQQFADIMILIGYLASLVVILFGRSAIVILYGIEFEPSSEILTVYILSGIFTCLSYTGQAYYIIHKDTKVVMWINVFGALINFLLNCVFINIYGGVGAALATLIEYMIIAFGQMILLRRQYKELYIIQLKALFPFIRLISYLGKKCSCIFNLYIRNILLLKVK